MPWSAGQTDPKYRSREHRDYRAGLVKELEMVGHLTCQAKVCVMPTRMITNPNGRARDGLHAGHNDDGVTYRGPEHNACNIHDAAVRGRAKQEITPWVL